jgi:catalase
VAHAGDHLSDDVQRRVIGYWTSVDPELGAQVAAGLGSTNGHTLAADGASADLRERR